MSDLVYTLQLANDAFVGPANEARGAMRSLGDQASATGARVGGLRTSFQSASSSVGGFLDKAGHLGANLSNIVSGVKATNEVIQYMRGATTTTTTAVTGMSTSVATAAVRAGAMGTGARLAGGALGFMGAAAGGAAVGVGAITAAAGVLLPVLLAVGAAVGVAKAALKGIGLAADLEQLNTSMVAVTGSTEAAARVIDDLKQISRETGLDLIELAGVAKNLLAERIPEGALSGEIRALGVIAKVTGSDLAGIALAYKQVASAGRVLGDELNQFSERGAGAIKAEMQSILGVSGSVFRKMQEDGQITFSLLQQAVQNLGGETGKWSAVMRDGADDTWTLLKQIGSALKDIFLAFGQPINDGPLKAALQGILTVVQTVRDAVQTTMAVVTASIEQGNIGETLGQAFILGIKTGANALISGAMMAIDTVVGFFQTLPERIAGALATVASAIKAAFSGALDEAKSILASFKPEAMQFDTTAQDKFFADMIAKSKSAAKTAGKEAGKDWAKELDAGAEAEGKTKTSTGGGKSGRGTAQGMLPEGDLSPMPRGRISRGTIRRGDGDLMGLPEGFTPDQNPDGSTRKLSGLDMHDLLNERRKSRVPGTTEIGTSKDLVIPIGQGFDRGTNPKGLGVKTPFQGLKDFQNLQDQMRKVGDKALPTPGQQARKDRREAEARQQEAAKAQQNPRWDLVERIANHVEKLAVG